MSKVIGAHHRCFTRIEGLAWHAAAPSIPPMSETAAAGFFRRIQEHTINFLMIIAATASAINSPNAVQLPFAPMPERTHVQWFLAAITLAFIRKISGSAGLQCCLLRSSAISSARFY
jgi:hypothetical protein